MKNQILFIGLIIITLATGNLNAQELGTIFSKSSSESSFGGFGGPMIGMSSLKGNAELMIGGRGGVLINRKWAFGGIGMAIGDFSKYDSTTTGQSGPTLGLIGVFGEYIFNIEKPVHISIPLYITGGQASYTDSESGINQSSTVFSIEPGVNVHFNATQWFVPAIHVSYRFVTGSELGGLSNQDLSGLNVGLEFNFGKF